MTEQPHDPRSAADMDDADHIDNERHGILEAFNAEGVVEHPGRPRAMGPEDSPASDADAPPPA